MDVVRLSPDGRELRSLLTAAGLGPPTSRSSAGEVTADPRQSTPGLAGRRLLGIVGAPGAGKSTLAAAVARATGAVVVPMDGFHLADVELTRRGLLERKGAPETFDGWGYAALLARLARPPAHPDEVVMAPGFERDLEQPLAGAIPVPPGAPVVTEGNYLLLDDPAWRAARACLDQVWFVETDETTRVERLVARHVAFGKSHDDARAWVESVDQPNALLVARSAARADVRLELSDWRP